MSSAAPASPSPPPVALVEDERIRAVCAPCGECVLPACHCRLLDAGGDRFLGVFEQKRCRPREFLERFLVKRLTGRPGTNPRSAAEDIASDVVLSLYQSPPAGPLLPPMLDTLRRYLAARAVQREVDALRQEKGRIRCGTCLHHREASGGRRCGHPDPAQPWHGREVRASDDPRTFDPPCLAFVSRRDDAELPVGSDDRAPVLTGREPGPEARIARKQQISLLVAALAAVQRRDPAAGHVLVSAFVHNLSQEEIARELGVTVRSVTRYKSRGLDLLRAELAGRGLMGHDVVWGQA